MTPERLEDLLWQRHDGCISDADLAELEEHLSDHPEARKLEAAVAELARRLESMPRLAAPQDLRPCIDQSLATLGPPRTTLSVVQQATKNHAFSPLRSRLIPLAAGLLLGAAIVQLVHTGLDWTPEPALVSGSMRPSADRVTPPELVLDFADHGGQLRARRIAGDVQISLELVAPLEVELSAEQPAGGVRVRLLESTADQGSTLRSDANRCVLSARGPLILELQLAATDPTLPLRLELSADGAVVIDRWLAGKLAETTP